MPDKRIMLDQLAVVCKNCGMCDLGWQSTDDDLDPHVFADYPTLAPLPKFMVVGQNPGINEVLEDKPFVGAAGRAFNEAIDKYGTALTISRETFYVSNVVKCYTRNNAQPSEQQVSACSPYLAMEVGIIKPKLIIALGAVAFAHLCPGRQLSESLGKVWPSRFGDKYKVFPTYHPSPRNLEDPHRRARFEKDIQTICQLIFRIISPF
jgi:DNA polymerase